MPLLFNVAPVPLTLVTVSVPPCGSLSPASSGWGEGQRFAVAGAEGRGTHHRGAVVRLMLAVAVVALLSPAVSVTV